MNYLVLALVLFLVRPGEPTKPTPSSTAPQQEMKSADDQQKVPTAADLVARFTKYRIALVRKGPNWTKDAPKKIEELAKGNAKSWHAMVESGKLVGVARLVNPKNIWGLLFFKVESKPDMDAIVANAPAVKKGLLAASVYTVWGTRGLGAGIGDASKGGEAEATGQTYFLVVNEKGPKWSAKADAPETRQATNESMEYLFNLYKDGKLRYFAALEDMSLKARNISIVKAASADEALKMFTDSPSVKKDWFKPTVFEVKVPDGVIP